MGLKHKVLKLILLIAMLWFPFIGTDCNKSESSIIGTWELVKMNGNAQDVCLGETAVFQTTGNATLTCPGEAAIQKTYTYSGNILTFTTNSLSYSVSFTTQNGIQKVIFTGRNGVDRVLTYDKISN
ncbi:MAG: hypothetical protein NTU73_11010 [Ignavibacteriae bacterium]|nr:hypothetical protein [Ignavibacteriota bacterium]